MDDARVDTVVSTWTLCSIPEVEYALGEVRRWQKRLNPIWKRVAGGCYLNRPIQELVRQAGFDIARLETGYMEGPRPMTFMYEGCALRS